MIIALDINRSFFCHSNFFLHLCSLFRCTPLNIGEHTSIIKKVQEVLLSILLAATQHTVISCTTAQLCFLILWAYLYSCSDFSVNQYYRLETLLWAFVSLQICCDESLESFLLCVPCKICMHNKGTNHYCLFVADIKCIPKGRRGRTSKLRWFERYFTSQATYQADYFTVA